MHLHSLLHFVLLINAGACMSVYRISAFSSLATVSSCTRLGSVELCAFAQLHTFLQSQGRCMTTIHVTGDDQQKEAKKS